MRYPALDLHHQDGDLVIAAVDDYAPTAVDERDGVLTIFFASRAGRDAAREAIAHAWPQALTTPREVDDEDWARRSQQNLKPVTVGRITIVPDLEWLTPPPAIPTSPESAIVLVIEPSMGFGTGHHATTRRCLAALQAIDLHGMRVVDVGTGSGVLAIAARRLGARRAVGIDNDPDAVQAARSSLLTNPGVDEVAFEEAELASWLTAPPFARERADVITANLTGALLIREAAHLAAALAIGGRLVVSGLLACERRDVAARFEEVAGLRVVWESEEEEWVGLILESRD